MTTLRRFLARRLAFTVGAVWALITGMFALVTYVPDPNLALVGWGAAVGGSEPAVAVEGYLEARGRGAPVHEQYFSWIVGFATFEWGWSHSQQAPVRGVVLDAVLVSAVYIVPAVVISTVASLLLGYYTAIRRTSPVKTVARVGAYACAAVPAFLIAAVALNYLLFEFHVTTIYYDEQRHVLSRTNLETLAIPTLTLALTLFGVQARYVRSQAMRFGAMDFTKLARSKGVGEVRVARHVLRNAAVPLLSISFAEVLTVFVLTIYVLEIIFHIPGIGLIGYEAIDARDFGMIFGAMLVPVLLGLLGNLLLDVAHVVLDPRASLE